jgi:hypothetical protein
MSKKTQISIVFEADNQTELLDFWGGVFDAELNSGIDVVKIRIGNSLDTSDAYKNILNAITEPTTTGLIHVDKVGEHFHEHISGVFANNPQITQATKIYPSLAAMQRAEGPTDIKVEEPVTENEPENPDPQSEDVP